MAITTISSTFQTFLVKVLLSGIELLGAVFLIHLVWFGLPSHPGTAPLAVRIIVTPIGLLIGLYFIKFSMKIMRVGMDGMNLYLSSYVRQITVPFSNIDDIQKKTSARGMGYISVTFREPTEFGKHILFVPKSDEVFRKLRAAAKVDKVCVSHTHQSTGQMTLGAAIVWRCFLSYFAMLKRLEKLPRPIFNVLSWIFAVLFFVIFGGIIILPGVLFRLFLPTHILESLICVSVMLYPFVLLLFVIKVKDKSAITIMPEPQWTFQPFATQFLLSIYVLLGFVGIFYAANVMLDSSPAQPTIVNVVGKEGWQCFHRNARCVEVVLTAPTPLPFTFTNIEDIELSYRDYDDVKVDHSEITLFLHHGFFGLPWYESRYVFTR